MKFIFLIKSIFLIFLNLSIANCSFQTSLFSQMNNNYKNKNLIISPFSIYQALSLTANGARTKTLGEILSVLQSDSLDSLNEINLEIINIFKDFNSLELANGILTQFTPLEEFISISKKYLAPMDPLKTAEQVNDWVTEKTHGKITHILDDLDPNVRMIILNAVYFKGQWVNKFSKEKTTKKNFYNYGKEENSTEVDIMYTSQNFLYYEDEEVQAIQLQYQLDSMSALVILPQTDIDINEYIKKLDDKKIKSILKGLNRAKINLQMPKFELEFSDSLKNILIDMGIIIGFTNSADFTGLKKEDDLKIGDVLHKTYLKVNEEGTEATGATVVEITTKAMTKKINMNINRPFIFLIRSDELPSGNDIVFMSKIEEIN